jgi:hypothetical protein
LLAVLLATLPAGAEVGDCSALQASLNLLLAKKADAPFSAADAADIPIEVSANPRGRTSRRSSVESCSTTHASRASRHRKPPSSTGS